MRTVTRTLLNVICSTVPALVAGCATPDGIGLLGALFIGFGAYIIISQLIPGLALFGSMMQELSAAVHANTAEAVERDRFRSR